MKYHQPLQPRLLTLHDLSAKSPVGPSGNIFAFTTADLREIQSRHLIITCVSGARPHRPFMVTEV